LNRKWHPILPVGFRVVALPISDPLLDFALFDAAADFRTGEVMEYRRVVGSKLLESMPL
jgi:hypothetical protein